MLHAFSLTLHSIRSVKVTSGFVSQVLQIASLSIVLAEGMSGACSYSKSTAA